MPDTTHHVPLTFVEALSAVRRSVLEPDVIPAKVVAGAVRMVAPAGPSRAMVDSWSTESATGPAVADVASLLEAARRTHVGPGVAEPVHARYGEVGVVAAVALASVLAAESLDRPLHPFGPTLGLGGRRLGSDLLGLAQQLHRSCGVIPHRWRALSLHDRTALRWWDAHEGAMVPGWLTGEEKWLAMASLADAMGDTDLSRLYAGFLAAQGWDRLDVEAGIYGRLSRLRNGLPGALRGVRQMVISGLDRRRVELAGADIAAEGVAELVDLARLARGMVVIGTLD